MCCCQHLWRKTPQTHHFKAEQAKDVTDLGRISTQEKYLQPLQICKCSYKKVSTFGKGSVNALALQKARAGHGIRRGTNIWQPRGGHPVWTGQQAARYWASDSTWLSFFLLTGELLLLQRARLNDPSYKPVACVLQQGDSDQTKNEWKEYVGREADWVRRSSKSRL